VFFLMPQYHKISRMVTAGVTLLKMPLTGLFSNSASGAVLPSCTWRNPVHAQKMAPKTGADQERWPWQSDGCSRNHHKPMAPKHILNLASTVPQAAIATAHWRRSFKKELAFFWAAAAASLVHCGLGQ